MYYRVLIYSIIFHLCLFASLTGAQRLMYQDATLEEVVLALGQDQKRQVVIYAVAPDIELDDSKKAPFTSKDKQRVKRQSQAALTGKTKNRSPTPTIKITKKPKKNGEQRDRAKLGEITKPEPIDFNRLGSIYKTSGISTIGDRIFGDIAIGNFTALNTDKSQFYSFNSRVNERIRSRWINQIEASLSGMKRRGLLRGLKNGESRTIIEVRLDKKGYYKGSTLYQSSGLKAWDRAAIYAFQNGAPFINPPMEMVEEDGLIRMRYSFSVFWDPRYSRKIR